MKKKFYLIILAAITVASLLVGCNDPVVVEPQPEEPEIIDAGDINLVDPQFGLYFGKKTAQLATYYVVLSDEDAILKRDNYGEPYLATEGDMLVVEFIAPVAQDEKNIILPLGTYTLAQDASTGMTFDASKSYVQKYTSDGNQRRYNIENGRIVVDVNDDGEQTIEFDLTDGTRKFKGSWTGVMNIQDASNDKSALTYSTLSSDVECDLQYVQSGTMTKFMDIHNENGAPRDFASYWRLSLYPQVFTEDNLSHDAQGDTPEIIIPLDAMLFNFVLPLDSNGEIAPEEGKTYVYIIQPNLEMEDPMYTYMVSEMGRPYYDIFDPTQADKYYFMTNYDYCNSARGYYWAGGEEGTWYTTVYAKAGSWTYKGSQVPEPPLPTDPENDPDWSRKIYTYAYKYFAPLVNGTFTVVRNANQYTLNWTLYDDIPAHNEVKGSWTGPVVVK